MLLIAGAVVTMAQAQKPQLTKTISICPIRLTDAGKTAAFRFGFIYSIEVGSSTEEPQIRELSNSQRKMKTKFIHDEMLVECMKGWRLEPEGRYLVVFSLGTTSPEAEQMPFNYVRISDPDKPTIIIELNWSGNDLLRVREASGNR